MKAHVNFEGYCSYSLVPFRIPSKIVRQVRPPHLTQCQLPTSWVLASALNKGNSVNLKHTHYVFLSTFPLSPPLSAPLPSLSLHLPLCSGLRCMTMTLRRHHLMMNPVTSCHWPQGTLSKCWKMSGMTDLSRQKWDNLLPYLQISWDIQFICIPIHECPPCMSKIAQSSFKNTLWSPYVCMSNE